MTPMMIETNVMTIAVVLQDRFSLDMPLTIPLLGA